MLEIFGRSLYRLGTITTPERELQQREEIIDLGENPVEDIWIEVDVWWGSLVVAVLVQDIWLGSTSVEVVNAPRKVPGRLSPCDYVWEPVGWRSERSIGRYVWYLLFMRRGIP